MLYRFTLYSSDEGPLSSLDLSTMTWLGYCMFKSLIGDSKSGLAP
jgi:hypothetical protein